MGTHRITVDLPEASYNRLRSVVDSGEFASESEAISDLLADLSGELHLDHVSLKRWMIEEVLPAIEEYDADPSSGCTPDQLRQHLAEVSRNWPNGA